MSITRKIVAALNSTMFFDNLVYKAKHGPARGLMRQGGMGWLPSFVPRNHEWDVEEDFLASMNWNGKTVFEVGCDQGLFTVFFADRVGEKGRVIAFEPNQRSCIRIERNVELNGFHNVRLLKIGLGERRQLLPFSFPSSEPARGSAAASIADQINHESGVMKCEIEVNSLDDEVNKSTLPVPDFIKIDVEGMELSALIGMEKTLRAHRPMLSIEIHGAELAEKIDNVRKVVAFLETMPYVIRHLESGLIITSSNAEKAREGHLFCEAKLEELSLVD